MIKQKILAIAILLISALSLSAQEIPERPNPPRLVNDFANILSPAEENDLEQKLVGFDNSTSTQITVVTVKSLNGLTANEFAVTLGHKWGVGRKGKDNGVVILVKPKDQTKGHYYISTGYGVEGVLPDAIANQIGNNEMLPYFKQGDYYGGINAATKTIMEITKGEYTADAYVAQSRKSSPLAGLFIIVVIFFVVFILKGKQARGSQQTIGGSSLPFWAAMALFGSANRHSGSYNNFRSGSGDFGGFGGFGGGGGGFGGFGGGGFGGGGAGGSW